MLPCMHARWGYRDKQTALLRNCADLCQLAVRCDGKHKHKQWGVSKSLAGGWKFDTASEAEYPLVFCQRVAVIVGRIARARGFHCIQSEPRATPLAAQASSQWRIAGGKQPRGRRATVMLPEDGQQVEILVTDPTDLQRVDRWQGRSQAVQHLGGRSFPVGTRILHQFPSDSQGGGGGQVVTFGIPMTPVEAVRRARQLRPRSKRCRMGGLKGRSMPTR